MMIRLAFKSLLSKKPWTMHVSAFSSIEELKFSVSFSLFGHPAFASRLRFSLNGKDELSPQSPGDCLFSIGLTSGDIIYYGFSPASCNVPSNLQHCIICPHHCQTVLHGKASEIEQGKLEIGRFSEPYLLRRVLCEDMGYVYTPTKLVIAAIHAVFLESGCVGFDLVSGLQVDLVDMLKEQASMPLIRSVGYTTPQLISNDNDTESIVLKFRSLGIYLIVYGSLAKSHDLGLHKLNIDISKYFRAIDSFWVTDHRHNENLDSTTLIAYAEKVKLITELWKFVKDGLALPLLVDLCKTTGLDLPPCLAHLPTCLKSRILELLPGQDIARVACVCREMKHLSDNDELWKEKYMSEFGSSSKKRKRGELQLLEEETNWKARFASSWEKKTKKREGGSSSSLLWTAYPYRVFGHPYAMLPKETGMPPPKYSMPCKPTISGIAPPPSKPKPYEVTPGMPKMNPITLGPQIPVYERPYIPRFGSDPVFKDRLPLPRVPPLPRIFGST